MNNFLPQKRGMQVVWIIVGCLIYAVGLNVFIIPMNLYSGGAVGLAQLLSYGAGQIGIKEIAGLNLYGIIYLLLNIPILFIAWFKIGKTFFINTILGTVGISLFTSIVPTPATAVIADPVIGIIIGGVVTGAGIGIMLTAKGDDMDKILGLEYGADDYITKPFNILEVKARIKAIFRRMEPKKGTTENTGILESGDMKLDRDGKRAYIQGREIGLTAKEFEVLELLMLNPDKVYSRENLLKLVWGTDYPGDVRTVDVHIRRLREKIESNPSEPRYVHTKWGVGYYFNNK